MCVAVKLQRTNETKGAGLFYGIAAALAALYFLTTYPAAHLAYLDPGVIKHIEAGIFLTGIAFFVPFGILALSLITLFLMAAGVSRLEQ